jgi:PAS domain S-box-containing protein
VIASIGKSVAFAGLVRRRNTVLGITALLVLILLATIRIIARSDRRQRDSELQVRSRDRELARVLESTHEAFLSTDASGAITAWNAQAERLYGWDASEVLGRSFSDTVVTAPRREELTADLARYLAGEGSAVFGKRAEVTALHRDGHEIPGRQLHTNSSLIRTMSTGMFRRSSSAMALALTISAPLVRGCERAWRISSRRCSSFIQPS